LPLHSQRIDVPTYDRSALQQGVVHIGAGNFHRAHQAVYFDDLACLGISDQWGVIDVSLTTARQRICCLLRMGFTRLCNAAMIAKRPA
jgi:mannitol-1-phosphate/altronate dehydrogenase